MNNSINKKLSQLMGKVDDKVTESKITAALDMLKKGNSEELARKLEKTDKSEILKKLDEFDESKLKDLNIDLNEVRSKIKEADFKKLSALMGENGEQIINKIKDILK